MELITSFRNVPFLVKSTTEMVTQKVQESELHSRAISYCILEVEYVLSVVTLGLLLVARYSPAMNGPVISDGVKEGFKLFTRMPYW